LQVTIIQKDRFFSTTHTPDLGIAPAIVCLAMSIEQHNPVHPGMFIKRVYIAPNNIDVAELARKLHVSSRSASRLLNGKTEVSAVMALKLSKVLGRSAESWLSMQRNYSLWMARRSHLELKKCADSFFKD